MRTATPTAGIRSWAATAACTAASTDVKPAAIPSPIVAKISPSVASTASRSTSKWASTRADMLGDSSHWRVDPTMSVNSRLIVARGDPVTARAGRVVGAPPVRARVSCSRRIVVGVSAVAPNGSASAGGARCS